MNSRVHGWERALAELAVERLANKDAPRILVGGLGMGFTQSAALAVTGPKAEIVVAELVPGVVDWHHSRKIGSDGFLAGFTAGLKKDRNTIAGVWVAL